MNLVKLQEDLKGLPMGVIQQYANGANPEVPPYIAAAEMQRRQAAMQRASNAQAAAGGPQPSVKEQLEQRLGLGSLQAQRQQQAMQGIAQQSSQQPMPVPAGAPQPEAQPEAAEGMARGGVASLPVRDDMFAYADGGVVGFQAGGDTDLRREAERVLKKPPRERTPEDNALLERAGYTLQRQVIPQDSMIRRLDTALAGLGATPSAAEEAARARTLLNRADAGMRAQPPAQAPVQAPAPRAPKAGAGIAAPRMSPQPAPAAPAAPAPLGLEALAAQSVRSQLTEDIPTPTEEEAMGSEAKFAAKYGYDKPYGAEQRALMEQMRADYEKRKEARGLETLIAGLAGGARGYGGVAAGYLDALNAQRAYDDEFARQMLEQTGALEGTDREAAVSRGTAAMGQFGDRTNIAAERRKTQRDVGAKVYELGKRADAAEELAKLRAELRPARSSGAAGTAGAPDIKLLRLQKSALDNEIKGLETQLKSTILRTEREGLMAQKAALEAERRRLLAMMGGDTTESTPATPARGPGTQPTASRVIDFSTIK